MTFTSNAKLSKLYKIRAEFGKIWAFSCFVKQIFEIRCLLASIQNTFIYINLQIWPFIYCTQNIFDTWVIFSRLALGFKGASVNKTGCSSGATRSSL